MKPRMAWACLLYMQKMLDEPILTIKTVWGGRSVRGWSNKDRYSAYDALSTDQLLERLGSWSPVVRERAAIALGRRNEVPIPAWSRCWSLLDSNPATVPARH